MAALHFCAHADRVLPAALAPVLRERYGLSDAALGLIGGTAFIIPFALATLLAGALGARADPRRLMIAAVAAWTAAGLLFAIADSFGELVLARVALGVGQAGFAPAAVAVLSRQPRPATAIAAFTAGSSGGRSGGLLIVGLLLTLATTGATVGPLGGWEPWRVASLWLLLPNLLLLLLLRRVRFDAPARGRDDASASAAWAWLRHRRRAFGAHGIAAAAAVLIVQSGGAWASSIVHRGDWGLTPGTAAIVTGAAILLAGPGGHLLTGLLFSRARGLAPGPVMVAGAGVAVGGCLLLALAPSLPAALLAVAVLSAGGGMATGAALIGLQPMLAPAHRLPVNAAYFAMVSLVGFGIGPLVTGLASDRLGDLAAALAAVATGATVVVIAAALAGTTAWRQVVAVREERDGMAAGTV